MKLNQENLTKLEARVKGQVLCLNDEVEPFESVSMVELVRLARLGLWAEEHGIAIVKAADSYHSGGGEDGWHYLHGHAAAAAAAIPKTDPTP